LSMLDRGKDMAEFKGFSLTIDKVNVAGDTTWGDQPDRVNIYDAMGGWEGVASYKYRCTP
jgi:hypothetical protein